MNGAVTWQAARLTAAEMRQLNALIEAAAVDIWFANALSYTDRAMALVEVDGISVRVTTAVGELLGPERVELLDGRPAFELIGGAILARMDEIGKGLL